MNFQNRSSRFASLRTFAQGMFNLNDPRWGRGEDKGDDAHRPEDKGSAGPERRPGPSGSGQSSDLDELWRDLNRRLSGFFGGGSGGGRKGGGAAGHAQCRRWLGATGRCCICRLDGFWLLHREGRAASCDYAVW